MSCSDEMWWDKKCQNSRTCHYRFMMIHDCESATKKAKKGEAYEEEEEEEKEEVEPLHEGSASIANVPPNTGLAVKSAPVYPPVSPSNKSP